VAAFTASVTSIIATATVESVVEDEFEQAEINRVDTVNVQISF